MQPQPLYFIWTDDGTMRPLNPRAADRQYVVGEKYRLQIEEERSANSHRHYFAAVNEAWKNLPEAAALRFPTSEHLRKFALIKAGYADERSVVCLSPGEAAKVAAFVKPLDDFAIVTVSGHAVKVYTAKSQSVRSMQKGEFQHSKTAVLEIVAEMVGVTPAQLQDEAGRAA